MPTIEDVIRKYIELRDRKAELAKAQAEQMKPLSDGMEQIENYLMHRMNELGCDSLKANGVGTAFKANSTSVQMQDAVAFKEFVFEPAAEAIFNQLVAYGFDLPDTGQAEFLNILRDLARWDMVDFRAGKKGIQEYIANENAPVPGVSVNTVATISVRRA